MILVSALGAVLVGLIASRFLAHPGLFRDAFRLRQAGSHQIAQTDLHLSVSARHPGRLIYAESYLFTTDGAFLGTEGRLDSNLGKLALYSIYRLHFGNFAGTFVKLLYLAFGLALAAVAASGVNIWLAKRRRDDGLSDLWVGIVWGTPLALAVSAAIGLYADMPLTWIMWAVVAAACAVSLAVGDRVASKRILRLALLGATLLLVICHAGKFGSAAYSGAPGGINLGLIAFAAIGCAAEFWPGVQQAATRRRPAGLGR